MLVVYPTDEDQMSDFMMVQNCDFKLIQEMAEHDLEKGGFLDLTASHLPRRNAEKAPHKLSADSFEDLGGEVDDQMKL